MRTQKIVHMYIGKETQKERIENRKTEILKNTTTANFKNTYSKIQSFQMHQDISPKNV